MDQHSIWRTSLMSIQRFYLGDRDIPLGGYINAIKEWFTWEQVHQRTCRQENIH